MAKIVIELEIEGDAQRAYDVVNDLLDMGEFQDRINEFHDDNGTLCVTSATVRLDGAQVLTEAKMNALAGTVEDEEA